MRIRQGLGGAAAAALLIVCGGAGAATAQTVTPHTGAAPCNDGHPYRQVVQQTKYHGVICYENVGYDNLRSSGFWTLYVAPGCNEGWVEYVLADGTPRTSLLVPNGPALDFTGFPSGVVSLVGLDIHKVDC